MTIRIRGWVSSSSLSSLDISLTRGYWYPDRRTKGLYLPFPLLGRVRVTVLSLSISSPGAT
jgi:hypothetical protein